jgi:hypothetical protein
MDDAGRVCSRGRVASSRQWGKGGEASWVGAGRKRVDKRIAVFTRACIEMAVQADWPGPRTAVPEG